MREQSYLFALAQGATRRRDTGCFIQQATRHAGLCLMVDNRKLAIISRVSNTFMITEIRDRLGVGFLTQKGQKDAAYPPVALFAQNDLGQALL